MAESIATSLLGVLVTDNETPDDKTRFEITGIYINDGEPFVILAGEDGKFWHCELSRVRASKTTI